jgi:hypothetical protein
MRALLLLLTSILALAGLTFYGCDRLENPQHEYSVFTEEIVRGGSIPRLLPQTAREIRTQTNMDTNEAWIRFKPGTSNYSPLDLGFRRVEPINWPADVRLPRHSNWWFNSLAQFHNSSAALYAGSCEKPGANAPARQGHILLVAGEVYVWCGAA